MEGPATSVVTYFVVDRGVARIYGKGVLTGARRAPEKIFVATPTNNSVILRHFLYVHYVH